jgi:ribosomal protein S18 acetylase RimI-like enzyme
MAVPAFRLATSGDAELVKAISASAYIPAYRAVIGAVPKPAFEDYRSRIQGGNVWIAEVDGKAAGILVLEEGQYFLTIYSIAVAPEFQGRGIAKALLAHAEDYARKKMLPELRLYTNKRMERNVAVYVGYGFTKSGERPHPSRKGEVLIDMAKPVENTGCSS